MKPRRWFTNQKISRKLPPLDIKARLISFVGCVTLDKVVGLVNPLGVLVPDNPLSLGGKCQI